MTGSPTPRGPRGSLLLGSALALQRDQLGTYEQAMLSYGDIARFRVGPPRVGFEFDAVFTPDAAHQVVASDAGIFAKDAPVFDELARLIGDGLLSNNDDRWRRHRRVVQPLFTRRRIGTLTETVAAAADEMVARWDRDAGTPGALDLHDAATRYALRVLSTAILGDDVETVAPTLEATLPVLNREAARRGLAPVRLPSTWPTPANRRAERARATLWSLVDGLVDRRRSDGDAGSDLLSLLLQARDPDDGSRLDDDDVRTEALTFLVAGHETTSAALALTLNLLGRHQGVQDRVREEVAGTVAAEGPLAESSLDIDRLPYTGSVVREALRCYPLGHTVVRRARAETTLCDVPIPEGHIVAVSVWGIHHNPAVWPEPHRFDPDRFTPERMAEHHRYAHLPFGGGPRRCIGESLAMLELVTAVAAAVRAYRFEAAPEPPSLDVGLTLRPSGSLVHRMTPV